MKTSALTTVVSVITVLLLMAGFAGGMADRSPSPDVASMTAVSSGISYQGWLSGSDGIPLNGTYAMRFIVYDAEVAGSAIWDSGDLNVTVAEGSFNVKLGVSQTDFDGRALWLSIIVQGETLSPRQEILPAPYALSLRPGAVIIGDAIGASGAVLSGHAPATGTALHADANGGVGLSGASTNNYGVWGSSGDSWGGYFTSEHGYGLRVNTAGTDHYDHGAYITSQVGYAVYAQSAQNQAVRGEAGNVSGISQPLGAVGVVGIGSNRGTYGSSAAGVGLYGISDSNYGAWGSSSTWRGVTGRTSRADNNYGFYTPDNIFSLNVQMAGALMQVMQNGGSEPLSPGDVVVFSGINHSVMAVDGPIVQVRQAATAGSTAVAGVVFSRFNIDAIDPELESSDGDGPGARASVDVTPPGSAAPGEYVLVVVQGLAQVKASALGDGEIQPGDLLSTSSLAGSASRAQLVTVSGMETALPGTVFGKALEPLRDAQELIYVYVTLH
jgi:hypothetical protein